jgi:hypothetical protein
MGSHFQNSKIQFLYSSISDIQSTIRAIDTKISFLIVVLSLPSTGFDKVSKYFLLAWAGSKKDSISLALYSVAVICSLIFWFLAFLTAIRTVVAIDDPSEHILYKVKPTGSFYCRRLFDLKFIDAVFHSRSAISNRTVLQIADALPKDENELIQELAFEQMKLAYIRDLKLLRQKWSFVFVFLCFFWIIVVIAVSVYLNLNRP